MRSCKRQANDIGATSFDGFDKDVAVFLKGVGTGFVESVYLGKIGRNRGVIKLSKTHIADFVKGDVLTQVEADEMNACGYLVRAARKQVKHLPSLFEVFWFAERCFIQPDQSVRT